MGEVLSDFIEILVGGISDMATGIGSGISDLVTKMFLTTSSTGEITGLSAFGGVIALFAGVSLAVGLSKLIFNLLRRQG